MNSCRDRNGAGIEAADLALMGQLRIGLRSQLDSGREHPPRDMSRSETGYCCAGIDEDKTNEIDSLNPSPLPRLYYGKVGERIMLMMTQPPIPRS
eukprot:gene20285-biopygen6631